MLVFGSSFSPFIEILFKIRRPFEMECQVDNSEHVRHLLFAFHQKHLAVKSARDLCALYADDFSDDRMAQKRFTGLKEGNFKPTDSTICGRHIQSDTNQLYAIIK